MIGKKTAARQTADEQTDSLFVENRAYLSKLDRTKRQELIEQGLISRSMMDRIMDSSVPDDGFQRLSKARVNEAIIRNRVFDIPSAIHELIGKTETDGVNTLKKLHGRYRYFRFFAASSVSTDIELVEGDIRMMEISKNACFEHRSHNWGIDNPKPEHKGFIFRSQASIYMLGFGDGLIRLAIGNMPPSKSPGLISGIVLSKRSDEPYEPFAARFLMVPENNSALLAQLRDESLKHSGIDHNWKQNPQKREQTFFEYVKSDENFHMLYEPLKKR